MEILGGEQVQPGDRSFEFTLTSGPWRFLEDDTPLLGEQPERILEQGKVLDLHDEGEVVAALPAAIAMPELLFRRHIEGWGLLLMEGAEALQIPPRLLQSQVFRDEVHQVKAILDLLNGILFHRRHGGKLTAKDSPNLREHLGPA